MKIALVTTQAITGSTVVGRVLPLAHCWASEHEVHVFGFGSGRGDKGISWHNVGQEPFRRERKGKKRYVGLKLVINMLLSAWGIATSLQRLKPQVVVVVKALPHNVLGVWWWRMINHTGKIIIDEDDFELTANQLTSMGQRAAVHWAERKATRMGDCVIVATPFLLDHWQYLKPKGKVYLVPTGTNQVTVPVETSQFALTLTYLGSISLSSGHRVDMLPEILRRVKTKIPTVKMIVAGSGDDSERVKRAFNLAGLLAAVRWLDRFTDHDVPDLLAKTTVIIDPIDASITNRAKSSYRVTLAAVCGLPIVSSNIGIRPRLLPLKLRDRFMATPGDAKDYADKVIQLIRQPLTASDKQLLQEKGREFTWPVLAERYLRRVKKC